MGLESPQYCSESYQQLTQILQHQVNSAVCLIRTEIVEIETNFDELCGNIGDVLAGIHIIATRPVDEIILSTMQNDNIHM